MPPVRIDPSPFESRRTRAATSVTIRFVSEPRRATAHPEGSPYLKGIAIVGSGRSTVEEQFLTKKLADKLSAPVSLVSRVGPGDKVPFHGAIGNEGE